MSVGRPRASSQAMIAEAACELFLEQGYEHTTVAAIAGRAGVSRSGFFNYFGSKSEILWAGFDERLDRLDHALTAAPPGTAAVGRLVSRMIAEDFTPDVLALSLINASAMGVETELARESALRRARIAASVAEYFRAAGTDPLRAEVIGAAWGGAVVAALESWAAEGPGRSSFASVLERAVEVAGEIAT